MKKYSFNVEDLTSEKSLWDVYKLSKRISPNKFQLILVTLTFFLLAINALYFVDNTQVLLNDVRKWSEIGFSFAITTLGFLIAGFTIFATLSKPGMFLAMMDHIDTKTGLPTLKYNFFTFMKVFIGYLFFSIIYLSIVVLGQSDGFLDNLVDLLPNSLCIKIILIKAAYIVIGGSFMYLLLLLKSFIFNIYAVVMNFLRWEYHQDINK